MNRALLSVSTTLSVVLTALVVSSGRCQKITNMQRSQVLDMLQQISPDIQKHYYDPKLHGVDWKAVVAQTTQKIDAAGTEPQATSEVAAALMSLNDSHTFFLPPAYDFHFDYGWQGKMIGDRCFVTRVRPGSDAEKQGVKPGDEVLAINGYVPTRENFWKMQYSFHNLRPQPGLVLDLRDPSGQQREVQVATKMVPQQHVLDATGDEGSDVWDLIRESETASYLGRIQYKRSSSGDVGIVKLPSFDFGKDDIARIMNKTKRDQALVLDLRGNPGGRVDTLEYLVGAFFDRNVKIGDRVSRKDTKPVTAKKYTSHPFAGKLIVLVDSNSGSAAEIFARVIQIEKRGTVLGDRSAGKVMEARRYTYRSGLNIVFFFGASITEADLIMTDGKSLENRGVTPDQVMLPTGADMAAGRDPVLAHAVEMLGGKIDPEAAGKLFPYEWPKI